MDGHDGDGAPWSELAWPPSDHTRPEPMRLLRAGSTDPWAPIGCAKPPISDRCSAGLFQENSLSPHVSLPGLGRTVRVSDLLVHRFGLVQEGPPGARPRRTRSP